MPLKMNAKQTDDVFMFGFDDDGNVGALLQPGQVATIVSADPATVVINQDASPRKSLVDMVLADGTPVPAGTQSVASAKVAAAPNPAQLKTPITITGHLANADGTPVLDDTNTPVADDVDTCEIDPSLLKKVGMLFGTAA